MVTLRRGDVVWLGQTKGARRPVVILTRNAAIGVLTRVVVAPVTRTVRGIPTEVALSRADGMPDECVVTADNVQAVPKGMLKGRITTLSPARLDELCEALVYALGC